MTEAHFVELQKKCYRPDDEWKDLFDKYNEKNKTNLDMRFRSGYLVILGAIAARQGFNFHPKDVQKHSPIKSVFNVVPGDRNIQ